MADGKSEFVRGLEKKKAAESLAVKWVERLIEPALPPSLLEEAVQFIEPRHYKDVIDERHIERLCGWPLCGHTLSSSNVPAAKYHVSMKQRTVIDLTERKKFCSVSCYRSSNYLLPQLSTEPVWGRTSRYHKVKLNYLMDDISDPGHSRSDVSMKPNQDKNEQLGDKQNAKDSSHMTNDHMTNILLQSVDVPNRKGQMEKVIVVEKLQKVSLEEYSTDSDDDTTSDHVTSDHVTSDHVTSAHVTNRSITSKDKLYKAMNYWYTSRTRDWLTEYLDNREKGEEMVTGGGCKKEDERSKDEMVTGGGCEREEERSKDGDTVFLPPVHGIERSEIQRNIFLHQLRVNLSQTDHYLGLADNHTTVSKELSALARTFRLSSDCIIFNPREWKVIISVLVMSLKLTDLEKNLHLKKWLDLNSMNYEDVLNFVKIFDHQLINH